ncbi:MAG: glycine betaine/L-proline ABC transporter ATP-binding protein ProV [Halorhodospira halophila]|uniref:glycine betaine/L-proline ABC transporter ATP-binding protein ProV n=1 Tax=Halorhodospira TaxID=85108 RepID=UPI0019146B72|nr:MULTISPECIES: glycine betaine/L-proline ABC transporter ATP-binding protein ProV [Halorhodospira]MBK5937241.1 glycine betaine/L-proline ABC transporter ATP-binding protein [Halorhodospira halophila]MBK5942563.1 glycine betaine/L-proline ABC transporter ATP-binding protein [Halorhodospira halophila]MCC3751834.1 glycine betaine/L-proline ABC transporter ATP-binding protein ProV [Halorhodospira halophila]MCG5528989.1 glycine betaine/L-proline ABC transporter ATP-binding protein ProV [Halorhodos
MTEKLVVEDLYKIFGPKPERAMELLKQGYNKDDIFQRTGNTVGVREASFTIHEGEVFVIMGLSGSGKSTMVRMFNRLIDPTYGHIYVDGHDIMAMSQQELINMRRRDMSMVFQSFALLPHKTVAENAAFGLDVSGHGTAERREKALQALEAVGLAANADSYPDELSGGMKQRVGLARALATDPSILLMDEAFSALDPLIRTEMQDELIRLQQEQSRTVIFISHDLDEAMRIGDRIAIMEGGQVVQIGTPEEIVSNPANEYVRSFFYGVDVSQVYNAGDIAERRRVTVIQRPGVDVRAALERLKHYASDIGVVIDRNRRFQGLVSVDSLTDAIRSGGSTEYGDAFLSGVQTIAADTAISDVLGPSAESEYPLVVVDDDGHYVGTLSRSQLLLTLDRTQQA